MGQSHMKNMNKLNPGMYKEDNTLLTDYDYSIKAEWIQHQKIMRLLFYTKNQSRKSKDVSPHIQEAQQTLSRISIKRFSPRHIIAKLSKDKNKEQIFKIACEKQLITYKGS